MDRPFFSIVIPTYQRREMVCEAVRALSRLDYGGNIELIVVVDGSTDGTAEAIQQLKLPFPSRIVEQTNGGIAKARNEGAERASGDILLFLDDDMMAAPGLLTQHAASFATGVDAVLGDIPLDPSSPPGLLNEGVRQWAELRAERLQRTMKIDPFEFLAGHLSIKRPIFVKLGGFDLRFTRDGAFGNEDLDFGIRLLERYSVVFNPGAITHQRYSVSPRSYFKQWEDAGRADVALARKHPRRADELFEHRGAGTLRHRFVLRPLSRLPGVRPVMSSLLSTIAQHGNDLPRPLQRAVGELIRNTRDIFYWAGVHSATRRQ